MTQSIAAHFDGKVIVPDEPVQLPVGQRLRVRLELAGECLPLLAAHRDEKLSVAAAEQLVRMAEDSTLPTHQGADLPKADKRKLLRKARQAQKK